MFIEHVRLGIAVLRDPDVALPFDFPEEVALEFQRYLGMWEEAARKGGDFYWTGEDDDDFVRHLVTYWYNLASLVDREPDKYGVTRHAPEADEFYRPMMTQLLDGLAAGKHAEFGARMRDAWPWPNRPPD